LSTIGRAASRSLTRDKNAILKWLAVGLQRSVIGPVSR
jgi:hypothetical protein